MSAQVSFTTILQRLLTLGVLVVAFFLSAGAVIYLAYGGREVKVPDLIGKNPSDAEGQLQSLGLRMRVTANAPSEKIDKDLVSEQEPQPGSTVKTGQSVRVVVSSGLVPAASPTPKATPRATPKASPKASVSPSPKASASPSPSPRKKPDETKTDKPGNATKSEKPDTKKPADTSGKPKTDNKDSRQRN